jgi:hypothetical protein
MPEADVLFSPFGKVVFARNVEMRNARRQGQALPLARFA